MDLIRWASLISDVEEEAADTIGTMYVVLLSGGRESESSRVGMARRSAQRRNSYLSDVRGFGN